MVENLLKKSKETQSLVGFNFYGSDNGFYCGYVLDFNEDFIIIKHFSKFGVNDGHLVHKLSDIKYIESDTHYLNGIQLLIQNQNSLTNESFRIKDSKSVLDNFISLFESLIGNKEQLIKFELNDGEVYFGFLEWCDETYFSIINIDNEGLIIGKAIFKFEDLKLYWIDDMESRKRKLFYKSKNANR
jgi:hypothetical protein